MSETHKERPIIFSAEMVRALLRGQKTVTRRVLNPQPPVPLGFAWRYPYGQPGDQLWVKETWRTSASLDALSPTAIAAKAKDAGYARAWAPLHYEADGVKMNWDGIWETPGRTRVSIHMPRWASRLTLDVVSVRTERLHDITEDDAQREGVNVGARAWPPGDNPHRLACTHCGQRRATHSGSVYACFGGYGTVFNPNTYRGGFAQLWESINGTGSWASNPLVWRVEFRVVKP